MLSFSCLHASIQSACIHSSLKHHSSIIDTALKHHKIVVLITKLITLSLSSYLDLELFFIALLVSSQFCIIAFYFLCERWSKTYTGGVTFAMDMLIILESSLGKITECGFANHASRIQLLLHCMCCPYVFYC